MNRNYRVTIVVIASCIVAIILLGVPFLDPPGTLTAPFLIPKASKADVGEIISLNIADGQKKGSLNFVYVINPNLKTCRLGVFSTVEDTTEIACLTVYAPVCDDPNNISNLLSSPFQAKIIDRVNITWEEGNVYIPHAIIGECDEVYSGIPCSSEEQGGILYYLGSVSSNQTESHFIKLVSGQYLRLKGGTSDGSKEFIDDVDVLTSIIERYKLEKPFGIS